MNESNKLIKLSSILNLILGIFCYKIPFYREILLFTGFILFIISNEENLLRHKNNLLKIAIILLPFNFLSSIIILFSNDKITKNSQNINGINAPPKVLKEVDKETKKIDILLKLGIGMIFTSGILFVTTSWDFISNPIKAFALIFLGLLFLVLSAFSEKKLNIYKTTYTYWLLSMIFFLLSIVGMEYFGIFGNYLTYKGLGKHLAYTITYLVITGLTYATYLKFPKKYLIYIVYISITSTIYTILRQIGLSPLFTILSLSIITLVINIIAKKDSSLEKYSNILSYLLLPLYCKNLTGETDSLILVTGFINILNHYYLLINNQGERIDYLSLIISHIFLFVSAYVLSIPTECINLIVVLSLTVNIVLVKFNILKVRKLASEFNFVFYSFSTLFIYLSTLYLETDNTTSFTLLISAIYLFTTIISSRKIVNSNEIKSSSTIEPLAILFVIISLHNFDFINKVITETGIIVITTIIYTFIHLLLKNQKQKNVYIISIIIGTVISLTSIYYLENFEALLLLIPSIYLFYNNYTYSKDSKPKLSISYIILMLTVYCLLNVTNILSLSSITSSIIFILILTIAIILGKIDNLKIINYILITIPLFNIVNEIEMYSTLKLIMESLISLYITFLLVKFIFKTKDSKNIFAIIGILVSLASVFFETDILVGLYVGIVGLIILMIGYKDKELGTLFPTGIIITIANIIYQLNQLWGEIPFWLYLLIGGLSIIVFVTYKELRKNKEKKDTYLH